MWLDDIKLYSGIDDHLRSLLRIVKVFILIRMKFGLDKYQIQVIHKGQGEWSIGGFYIRAMIEVDFSKELMPELVMWRNLCCIYRCSEENKASIETEPL